jgi:hypothetical protein
MIWTPKAYRELPKDEIKEHCIFAGKKMYPLHDGIYNGGDIEIANWYYNHKYIIPAFLAPQWEKERELRRERSLCLDKLKNDLQMTGKHLWWLFKLVVKRKKYSE